MVVRAVSTSLLPPLKNGDHLTRDEFERRYEATPGLKRAELIEGIVYTGPTALRWNEHARPDGLAGTWLGVYESATPGVQMGHHASIRLDLDNEPQPDAALIIAPSCGGQARISSDGYLEGAPELVVEISASSVSIDLNAKLRVYRRNGVREYLVWRVEDQIIDWFVLRQGEYVLRAADAGGLLRSETFPGLWLDAPAMIRLDSAAVLQALQQGLATSEHEAFVSALGARRSRH